MTDLKNIKFAWSKWGRTNTGLEKREREWCCQGCGEEQPEAIDPYLFRFGDDEYIRICPSCQNKRIIFHVEVVTTLILVCRKQHHWLDSVIR